MATNATNVSFGVLTRGPVFQQIRVGVDDSNYTVQALEVIVGMVNVSANRTIILPTSSAVGRRVIIKDESGSCTASKKIVINGIIDNASSVELTNAYAFCELYFNGTYWSRVA